MKLVIKGTPITYTHCPSLNVTHSRGSPNFSDDTSTFTSSKNWFGVKWVKLSISNLCVLHKKKCKKNKKTTSWFDGETLLNLSTSFNLFTSFLQFAVWKSLVYNRKENTKEKPTPAHTPHKFTVKQKIPASMHNGYITVKWYLILVNRALPLLVLLLS